MINLDPCLVYMLSNWACLGGGRAPSDLIAHPAETLAELFHYFGPSLRQAEDAPGIIALMRRVYLPPHGPESIWRAETLALQLKHFPQGQLLVKGPDGRVLADSCALVLPEEKALRPHTWAEITAGGTLATHDPHGTVFYGVNIAVDPSFQGLGLARKLYDARLALARRMGCRWFAAGARIPGYRKVAPWMSPKDYVDEVVRGEVFDPTLSKQLKMGFQVLGLLPDYAQDVECLGQAVLIARPV
ncbi:MAG TPA: GNAT family N-acetyltransferase [Holophagaceae bacterium]|nr:GNAT family N-acetyltransferase [Holophagaceae bacterium]